MEKDLFTYKEWELCGDLESQFLDCQMLKDFGSIKKDQKFDWIAINTETAIIQFGTNYYDPIKVKFRIVPDTTE